MLVNPPSPGFASAVIFFAASLWGLYWVPLRYFAEQGVSGGWAIALLNLPAGLALALLVLSRFSSYRQDLGRAVLIGMLTGLSIALYASGLVYSSVIRATLLFYLTPVWATLIGIAWLGEPSSWQRWAAIAAGLTGLTLLVSGGSSVPLNIGDLFALLSGILWAFGAAMIMRFGSVPVATMTMFQFFCTALAAIALSQIAGFATPPDTEVLVQVLPGASLVSLAVLLPTVGAIFWAQKFLFPGRAGLLMMSEVLTAVVSAGLLLPEERLAGIEWLGAALIIGACFAEVLLTPQQHSSS